MPSILDQDQILAIKSGIESNLIRYKPITALSKNTFLREVIERSSQPRDLLHCTLVEA